MQNLKSHFFTSVLFLVILFLAGINSSCTIEKADDSKDKTATPDTTQNKPKTFDGEYFFTGKPNDREMMLKIVMKQKSIRAFYYYTDDGKETAIAGNLTSDTTGEMNQYDKNGNVVEKFMGTFKTDGTADIVRQKPGDTTSVRFTITPLKDPSAYQPRL